MEPFRDHFSHGAQDYAASRPAYPRVLFRFLAGILSGRDRAWDAGCGSGQISVPLTGVVRHVVGADASAAQVRTAAAHPRVSYIVARAEQSGLAAGVADLCVAGQAVHWFDLNGYYTEVERVAKRGATVAIVGYGRPELARALDERVRAFHHALAAYWPAQRRYVDEHYASLPFPFREQRAPAFEMRQRWDLDRFSRYVDTWSAVRALEKDEGRRSVDEFHRDLRRRWGHASTARAVRWPLLLRVGTV